MLRILRALPGLLLLPAPAFAVPAGTVHDVGFYDYPAALAASRRRLEAAGQTPAAMTELARVHEYWRAYDSSLCWWSRVLAAEPGNDSARAGRWRALDALARGDSARTDSARAVITREATELLDRVPAAGSAGLAVAREGFALSNRGLEQAVGALVMARVPEQLPGYELIGAAFYDSLYPIWSADSQKVPLLHRMLLRFPRTEWRTTFLVYLLSSLYRLRDTTGLVRAVRDAVSDDPGDPFRARYAAAILNRLGVEPRIAAACARQAIELAPGFAKPPNKPEEQWELEYPVLLGSARMALAGALRAQDSLAAARVAAAEALAGPRFGPDLDATLGPHYALLGEICEQTHDTAVAETCYARSLAEGDVSSEWSARADSGLERLGYGDGATRITRGRELLSYDGPRFTDVTGQFGLGGVSGSRVAWGDYDDDGLDDLLVSGCRLFHNDSGVGFTDVTGRAGLAGAAGRGGVWADYDNDGRLDFYMCGSDTADRVWRNEGGRFRDVTTAAGYPSEPGPTEGAAWADFDNDGWVDLYCANYEDWETGTYYPDRLYRNRLGVFTDFTDRAGIIPPFGEPRAGRGVAWADFDDDGWQDCYVADYRLQENQFWCNNRDSTFTNRARELDVAGDEVAGWFGHTIGAAWGDYDNDGDLDLFTADLAHPRYIEFSNRSRLYENCGPDSTPRFRDRRAACGIRYEETHSNPLWADFDNDGDLDLYITSVYADRRSFLYENRGRAHPDSAIRFRDVTWLSGTRCLDGWGCASADFDLDGDCDLVVGSGSGVRLFRNDSRTTNHWLRVRCVGTAANRAGIGCRVTVAGNGGRWLREVEGGSGTTSQSSLTQHLGLGAGPGPLTVEVRFGAGHRVRLDRVAPDRLITVTEP